MQYYQNYAQTTHYMSLCQTYFLYMRTSLSFARQIPHKKQSKKNDCFQNTRDRSNESDRSTFYNARTRKTEITLLSPKRLSALIFRMNKNEETSYSALLPLSKPQMEKIVFKSENTKTFFKFKKMDFLLLWDLVGRWTRPTDGG